MLRVTTKDPPKAATKMNQVIIIIITATRGAGNSKHTMQLVTLATHHLPIIKITEVATTITLPILRHQWRTMDGRVNQVAITLHQIKDGDQSTRKRTMDPMLPLGKVLRAVTQTPKAKATPHSLLTPVVLPVQQTLMPAVRLRQVNNVPPTLNALCAFKRESQRNSLTVIHLVYMTL
jgi:hypothetical protein